MRLACKITLLICWLAAPATAADLGPVTDAVTRALSRPLDAVETAAPANDDQTLRWAIWQLKSR